MKQNRAFFKAILSFCYIFGTFQTFSVFAECEALPGRLSNQKMYYTQLGDCRIFFYGQPEKESLTKKFIYDFNDQAMLAMQSNGLGVAYRVVPVYEKMATGNHQYISLDPDFTGETIIKKYASAVKNHIQNALAIALKHSSFEIRLNTNQDFLYSEHENYMRCRKDLLSKAKPIQKPVLVQDVTMIDWQMASKTVAATLIQDNRSRDRFLVTIFPGEIVNTLYTQPLNAAHDRSGFTCSYAEVAPIELDGQQTAGSWKGKTIRTITRGIVSEKELMNVCKNSVFLSPNLPTLEEANHARVYPNQTILKKINQDLMTKENSVRRLPDQENLTILEESLASRLACGEMLKRIFSLQNKELKSTFRLIKRDGGFSRFNRLDLPIPLDSEIVILNHSDLAPGYLNYTISEDCTSQGKPWIQLYYFPNQMAMKVSGKSWSNLALTSTEELLYREEITNTFEKNPSKKIFSEIEVFVFN